MEDFPLSFIIKVGFKNELFGTMVGPLELMDGEEIGHGLEGRVIG